MSEMGSVLSPRWPKPTSRDIDAPTGMFTLGYARRVIGELTSRPVGSTFALAHVDIDGFARANLRYGHLVGDAVLAAIATQLTFTAGRNCPVCRVGGDKFLIIVPDGLSTDVNVLAETIRQRISETDYQEPGAHVRPLTVSIGTATFPADGLNADALLNAARDACYRAKVAGRNRVWCTPPVS